MPLNAGFKTDSPSPVSPHGSPLCALPGGNQQEGRGSAKAAPPPPTVAGSRGCTVGASKGGGHRDSAGPQAPPQVLGKQRTQPGGAPPRPLRDLKGTEGQVVGGDPFGFRGKTTSKQIGFQGSKSLHPFLPDFSKELQNWNPTPSPPHTPHPPPKPPGSQQGLWEALSPQTCRAAFPNGERQASPGPARTQPGCF